MNLRTKLCLSGKVLVCESGSFGISRISHMLPYVLPKLFKLSSVSLSFFHFKRHFRHMGSMAANVYKPFHQKPIAVKGVLVKLSVV